MAALVVGQATGLHTVRAAQKYTGRRTTDARSELDGLQGHYTETNVSLRRPHVPAFQSYNLTNFRDGEQISSCQGQGW